MIKYYGIFSSAMGVYYSIRGFQISHSKPFKSNELVKSDILIGDRLVCGLSNGALHALPLWNIYGFMRLMNRIEIYYRDLEKDKFYNQYQEVGGYNMSTL